MEKNADDEQGVANARRRVDGADRHQRAHAEDETEKREDRSEKYQINVQHEQGDQQAEDGRGEEKENGENGQHRGTADPIVILDVNLVDRPFEGDVRRRAVRRIGAARDARRGVQDRALIGGRRAGIGAERSASLARRRLGDVGKETRVEEIRLGDVGRVVGIVAHVPGGKANPDTGKDDTDRSEDGTGQRQSERHFVVVTRDHFAAPTLRIQFD